MLDFKRIEFIKESKFSFVGIKQEQGKTNFYLPHGFEFFDPSCFESVKRLFFRLYKIFKKFEAQKKITQDRDGTQQEDNGFKFRTEDGAVVMLYSKITMLDSILEGYDELRIFSLARKLTKTEHIDYSKLDKYMDKAIYLEDDTIYIDEMILPRPFLKYSSTDLIGLYCFIYREIKEELDEVDSIKNEIKVLAEEFQEKYLTQMASLFAEDGAQDTVAVLKDILEHINKNSPYKDADYWFFYEAIEDFLYSDTIVCEESGSFWGIDNFYSVWEEMCHDYIFKNFQKDVLFADSQQYANTRLSDGHRIYLSKEFNNPFSVQFNEKQRQFLRPDNVIKTSLLRDFWHNRHSIMESFFNNYRISLGNDNWDDFGHRILFNLAISDRHARRQLNDNLGVKIADLTDPNEYQRRGVSAVVPNQRGEVRQQLHWRFMSSICGELTTFIDFFQEPEHTIALFYIFNEVSLLSALGYRMSDIEILAHKSVYHNSLFRGSNNPHQFVQEILDIFGQRRIEIIDYKYQPLYHFTTKFTGLDGRLQAKLTQDIYKQIVYEYTLQVNHGETDTASQFWIPCYFVNEQKEKVLVDSPNEKFEEKGIRIFQVNFEKIQQTYLDEEL